MRPVQEVIGGGETRSLFLLARSTPKKEGGWGRFWVEVAMLKPSTEVAHSRLALSLAIGVTIFALPDTQVKSKSSSGWTRLQSCDTLLQATGCSFRTNLQNSIDIRLEGEGQRRLSSSKDFHKSIVPAGLTLLRQPKWLDTRTLAHHRQ